MNGVVTHIARRPCVSVRIGSIDMGGYGSPILVQSMTNTDTADVIETTAQIADLARAGSDMVRVAVNNEEAASAIPQISECLVRQGIILPLIGDFHFNGHHLLKKYPACAEILDKYRINPGNVGHSRTKEYQFATIIELACRYDKPVRIGVNWGSLDQEIVMKLLDENAHLSEPKDSNAIIREAMITSALGSARRAEEIGLGHDRIILSVKMSGVQDLIMVYRKLALLCDYPLHLGLTEAGIGSRGIVASTAALAVLLQDGIGDTIRISITPKPGGSRTQEVIVAQEILQAMGLRSFTPTVVACPGCGRTSSEYFQLLTQQIQDYLRDRMPTWRKSYPGVESMTVAVMGCVVNGPGESKKADVGISLPGTGEIPVAPVYVDGKKLVTLRGEHIATEFKRIVDEYVIRRYSTG